MRRGVGLAALLITSVAAHAPGAAAQAPGLPTDVSWQSAGDSYSSGEGVYGNQGACAQSREAYGPKAADLLAARGWTFASETFTACTGHLVEDVFHARGDTGGKKSLWEWGREQGGPDRVDVLTMSFGGNDIGFADVITGCLVRLTPRWSDLVTKRVPITLADCGVTGDELSRRADRLLDPPRRNCTTSRRTDKAYDCDLAIEDRRGSIIDFYYDIVTRHLTDRGRLYIVGYPRLFADIDQWPAWSFAACAGVSRGDTQMLGAAAEHFNNKLQEAVRRANEALGTQRVHFVDRFAFYRDGQHELCGRGEDWLNGITLDRGDGPGLRKQMSFRPNAAGHADTAARTADAIDLTFPRDPAGPAPSLEVDVNRIGRVRLGMSTGEAVAAGSLTNEEPDICGVEIGGDPHAKRVPMPAPAGTTVRVTTYEGRVVELGVSGQWSAPKLSAASGEPLDAIAQRLRGEGWNTEISVGDEIIEGGELQVTRDDLSFDVVPDESGAASSLWLPRQIPCE